MESPRVPAPPIPAALVERLIEALGADGVVTDTEAMTPYRDPY